VQGDRVWVNARLATMAGPDQGSALGILEPGALACRDGRIAWVGPMAELPPEWRAVETVDVAGRWITPGLVDCHTHLVFAGDRSDEFERRLAGVPYAEIARQGGGIAASVRATRPLRGRARGRRPPPPRRAPRRGVTRSRSVGLRLDTDTELAMLAAARRLGRARVSVAATYLAPTRSRRGRPAAYLRRVVESDPADRRGGPRRGGGRHPRDHRVHGPRRRQPCFRGRRAPHGLARVKLHADQLNDNWARPRPRRFTRSRPITRIHDEAGLRRWPGRGPWR
jgi:imidazolonepropionase